MREGVFSQSVTKVRRVDLALFRHSVTIQANQRRATFPLYPIHHDSPALLTNEVGLGLISFCALKLWDIRYIIAIFTTNAES